VFDAAHPLLWTATQRQRVARYLPELDNLRAALDATGAADDPARRVALTGASAWLWRDAGLHGEGLARCEAALAQVDAAQPAARRAALAAGFVELGVGRQVPPARLHASLDHALDLQRTLGDAQGQYLSLCHRARLLSGAGDTAGARAALDAALAIESPDWPTALRLRGLAASGFLLGDTGLTQQAMELARDRLAAWRTLRDPAQQVQALGSIMDLEMQLGELHAALATGREGLAILRDARTVMATGAGGALLASLAAVLTHLGDLDEALAFQRQAVRMRRLQRSPPHGFEHLALLAYKLGRPRDAARTLGFADAVAAADTKSVGAFEQHARAMLQPLLAQALGDDAAAGLRAAGATLGAEAAAQLALDGER
jgi:tetratricopeptide (TPR) repeat protein